MAGFLIGLFAFAAVVTIIAVVGHVLWLAGAAILRFVFQIGESGQPSTSQCMHCGHSTGLKHGVCTYCGFETLAARHRGLKSAIRQIGQMQSQHGLDPAIFDHAMQALNAAKQQLLSSSESPEQRRLRAMPQPPGQLTAQHETLPSQPFQPTVPDTPAAVSPRPAAPLQPAGADVEFIDAELVADGDAVPAVQPAHAAATASTVPDFARDTPPAPVAFSPRRTLADMLQSFMEEKNIRWGELASGMLIVGSAIGLVISLRATLAEISERFRYFPALLFMLGTVAIHAAGLYTLRRWKLRSTSRGVLIIATLLVPLSFVAGILLSGTDAERRPVTDPLYMAAVAVGMLGYGAITSLSAKSLFVEGWWRLVIAVLGTSAGQLIINRLGEAENTKSSLARATALFAVPLVSFLVATLAQLQPIAKKAQLSRARAAQTFTVLGIAAFALAVPLGLLMYRTGAVRETLTVLSPSLSLAAAVVMGIGMAVHARCASRQLAETRTVGTALAVFGGFLMAGAMVLAWPSPAVLIAVAMVTAVAFIVLASVGHVPVLHAGAGAAGTLAYLLIFLRLSVPLTDATPSSMELIAAFVMGRSALALALAAAVIGTVGGWFYHRRRPAVAWAYLGTTAAIAVVSAAIGLYAGFWSGVDADWTTLLFAFHGVAGLAAAWCWPRDQATGDRLQATGFRLQAAESFRWHCAVTWFGSAAALVALVHLLGWNNWVARQVARWELALLNPVLLAFIVHGLWMEVLALSARLWHHAARAPKDRVQAEAELRLEFLEPLATSGVVSAALAVPGTLLVSPGTLGVHAAYVALIALAWLIAGVVIRMPRLISAGYVAATVTIGFVVAALAAQRPWLEPVLGDLRHVQWQVIVLGMWCALTIAACWLSQRRVDTRELLRDISPYISHSLLGVLVALMVGLGIVGCYPGVLVELGFVAPDHAIAQDLWHTQAGTVLSWLAWVSVALALGVAMAQRTTETGWIAVIAITAAIPLLVSVRWESSCAVASAGRWTFAIYTLCWALLLAARRQIAPQVRRWMKTVGSEYAALSDQSRDVAIVAGTVPVLGLTLLAVGQLAQGTPWHGPLAETWFARLTPTVSYVVPLIVLVVAALILAVREGSAVYALLGSVICQCAIALALAVHVADSGTGWTTAWSVKLAQGLALGLVGYGSIWLTLSRWIDRDTPGARHALMTAQLGVAAAAVAWISAWALACLFVDPSGSVEALDYLGRWPSYLAVGLAAGCAAWYVRRDARQLAGLAVGLPVTLAPIVAASACAVATASATASLWLGYHLLTGVWLAVGLSAAGVVGWRSAVSQRQPWFAVLRVAGTALGLAVSVLVVRGCVDDPSDPSWTVGMCGGLCVLWSVLAISGRSQWLAYASVASVLFGTWTLWGDVAQRRGFDFVTGGVYVTVLAGALAALFWLSVEVWYQNARDESFDLRARQVRVHTFVAWTVTALMGLFVLGGVTVSVIVRLGPRATSLTITDALGVTALLALGILLLAMLWDRRLRATLLALYFWGLIAIAMGLNCLERMTDQGAELTVMAACLAGAGYIALTGHLWRWGANLAQRAVRLQIPEPIAKLEHTSRWLPALNVLGTLFLCFLGFVTIFVTDDRALRMGTAFAPAMLAYGVGCLAQRERRFAMQCFALLVLSLAAVYIGWADVRVAAGQDAVLAYAARLLISVAGMTLMYAVVVARWIGPQSDWYEAARKTSLILAAATIGAFATVLVLEVEYFTPGVGAPIAAPEVIAISVMLFGFVVALLSMAVWPGRDPLNLTEKGRTAYVYAAQLMSALLCAHVYLAEPQLFDWGLVEYWPYVVMLLAFGSVAFGEVCVRQNWRVIAEPMVRTGGFLPLLPALAAWAFSETSYPLVLFCAGLVYVFLAVTQRSFYAGITAALMGNGALWALMSEQGMELFAQPQFWLIPPAFSVLVAAHVNRAQLSDSSLTAIRYICVMIIYLSSAGEMFMKLVVPDAPEDWLRPIILASLAVAGIFAGILLRVRAFLYLGSSFLLLSIVAMVWNAGRLVQHTWPWWVFGITLGLAILFVFGVFEKHRRDVQSLIARLRQWDA